MIRLKQISSQKVGFIGCSPRSGSTLLIRILDSHSKIASPCEFSLPKYFSKDKKKKIVNNKYKQICNYYQANFWISKIFPKHLLAKVIEKEKKECVVLKDPRQSLFFQSLKRDFTNAKFIHLVRDVRAVAMSPWFTNKPIRGLEIWYEYNLAVKKVIDKLDASQKIVVRYEDIVQFPESSISQLTNFLGYDFEQTMLNYSQFSHADDKMKLWGTSGKGLAANEAPQHQALGTKISKQTMLARTKYSSKVLEAYQKLPHVREMNISFGYES